jgi:hypothetical protein
MPTIEATQITRLNPQPSICSSIKVPLSSALDFYLASAPNSDNPARLPTVLNLKLVRIIPETVKIKKKWSEICFYPTIASPEAGA